MIQRTIQGRYLEFVRCYHAGLAVDPELRGRVVTRIVIGRDGRVSAAHIQDTDLPDCGVARCVRDEMAKIVFPKSSFAGVTVVYPFMFAPEEPSE